MCLGWGRECIGMDGLPAWGREAVPKDGAMAIN